MYVFWSERDDVFCISNIFSQKLLFTHKKDSLENPYKSLSSSPRFTWNILCDFSCITLEICARLLQLH